jgi:hypothetical protein
MDFKEFQRQVNEARQASEERRAGLKTARQRLANLNRKQKQLLREIGTRKRADHGRLARPDPTDSDAMQAVKASKVAFRDALRSEWSRLNEYSQYTDPLENIDALDTIVPILLFPLRLEIRFKKVTREDQTVDQLWVRVFPDDIAINSFESDLSETEIRNTRSYWLARWKAGKDNVDGQRGAWRSLASAHGPGRAYWLTQNYIPLNAGQEPEKAAGEIILAIGTDELLTEPELGAIITYWQAVWKADKDSARLNQARTQLLTVVNEDRATDLIKNYKPSNLSDFPPTGLTRDQTVVRVEFVIFPKTDELETKLHAWSQPPTTAILPERFVFLAYTGRELAMPPQLGNLIPPQLILGPDPAAEEGEDFRLATEEDVAENSNLREGDLIVSDDLSWMVDFDEAVAKGMGFKINLSADQAMRGFDRVFVLGVKLSADNTKGKDLLEKLFAQHQSSRKGLSILKQGTPTNNVEEEDSGYSWRHDTDDSFDIYFGESSPEEEPTDRFHKSDGRWLADLLGIEPTILHTVENYNRTDIAEAKAMQRALWPATAGHFMDSMMNPVFGKETIELTRLFYTRYVSGRGNLPVIRVGKQPYGIVPTTDYKNMGWFRTPDRMHELSRSALAANSVNFLERLYEILMDVDQTWANLVSLVSYVGKAGDPHQILLDIVGLHPDSVELYKRYANTMKQIHNLYNAKGFAHSGLFGFYSNSYTAAANLLAKYGYTIDAEHPEPDIFKKSFFKQAWALKGDRIDKVPNSEVNEISKYTPDTPEYEGKNYIGWLIKEAKTSHDQLRLQAGFIDDKPPTALLYLLLHHALDLSYIDASLKLHLKVLPVDQVQKAYIEPDLIHIEERKETESRWKYLYKSDVNITGDPDILLGRYIALNRDTLAETVAFNDVLAALEQLEHVPTAALERALMEHIDTVSYRYDSWILGYLHLQLEYMRGLLNNEDEDRDNEHENHDNEDQTGIYLGAYGWLEDVIPENKVLKRVELLGELKMVFDENNDLVEDLGNAGYILAPSQNHAVTAAVLRNGHLSNDDPEDKEELKIKLSSERVREALQIIEGIQAGQTLSALLGYQFERGLHDRTDAQLDGFIFDLRDKFPLRAKKLKDTAPTEDDTEYESIEQIEAKNVIDGVAFLEQVQKPGNEVYPFGLDNLPESPLSAQVRALEQQVQELIDLNDAVADVALAESVHQVVLGNYERAAATLETYSKGNFPPTPEVIQTPRSGTVLTHRVALQFKSGLSHDLNDTGVTARMAAEPAIQDWLSHILPGMDQIVCVVSYCDHGSNTDQSVPISLSDIGLSHLDALYLLNIENDQAMSALDDRIIQHVLTNLNPRMDKRIEIGYTSKQDDTQFSIFEMSSLIASLRALLLKSKPLTAADAKLANEAAKENEQSLRLDQNRVQQLIAPLAEIGEIDLVGFIAHLDTIFATNDVNNVVDGLDSLMNDISGIFTEAGRYGMTQAGTGFIYQRHQSIYTQLRTKLDELMSRLELRRTEYLTLRTEYEAGVVANLPDEQLFAILRKAELKISTTSTVLQPTTTPADYFAIVDGVKFDQFETMLDDTLPPLLQIHSLTDFIKETQVAAGQLSNFDTVGISLDEDLKQVGIFAMDLKTNAENLSTEIQKRVTQASDLLGTAAGTGNTVAKVDLIKNAARAIFGDDFVMVPEFTVEAVQGTEWQNTLDDSENSLRYILNDLALDFPMDDWLYGIGRVREKLYHLENAILHIEGLKNVSLSLIPSQFPYREDDFWLGMQFPEKKPGTDEPYTIDEDKLLFTGIYTEPFDLGRAQCGLLLDEWTEVIPVRQETLGLTFHYDQPNSEPPQALLLITPTNFTGSWQWQGLVNSLHETLDLAKKRAVEPDHVDKTVYSRFLPPIVSLASPLPLTATLNLALNNQVSYAKAFENE